MLYLVGIVITFFLAVILASKKGKATADWILGTWLVAIGLHLTTFYLFITGQNLSMPYVLGFELPMPLLHGPFLYFYTRSVTGQPIRVLTWLHFAPPLASLLMFSDYYFLPAEQKVAIFEAQGAGYETRILINRVMVLSSGVVYVILSLIALRKHRKNLQNEFSYTEKINLSWLRYLIYGIALIWLSVIIGYEIVTFSLSVAFVIFIGYFGIQQVGLFTGRLPEEPAQDVKKTKYQKSSLNATSAESIQSDLTRLMNEQKLYTNPELTLAELARALNVNPNNLSQVINTYERKSFYDYVNLKRVDEFKRLASLPESQKFTLLGLAYDCGFNSKTSFNRNFKNATGMSPTEYLKQSNILLG
jgi:AraC-like DNA-binding protein